MFPLIYRAIIRRKDTCHVFSSAPCPQTPLIYDSCLLSPDSAFLGQTFRTFIWNVAIDSTVENEGATLLRNVGSQLPSDGVSHSWSPKPSVTPLWRPKLQVRKSLLSVILWVLNGSQFQKWILKWRVPASWILKNAKNTRNRGESEEEGTLIGLRLA